MNEVLSKERPAVDRYLRVTTIVLSLLLLILLSAFFFPKLREKLRHMFSNTDRKILATFVEDLERTGFPLSVFKVKEDGKLFVEIYKSIAPEEIVGNLQNQSFDLLQKIELPGTMDGFVSFMGETTNLGIANLDNDPYLELIVPSYNYEFIASLDIIKFNPAINKFELMTSFDIPEGLLGGFSREGTQ